MYMETFLHLFYSVKGGFMWWLNTLSSQSFADLSNMLDRDFQQWLLNEIQCSRAAKFKTEDSAYYNLATFSIPVIVTNVGYRRLCALLDNTSQEQGMARRLQDFCVDVTIKYSPKVMSYYIDRTIESMAIYYTVPKSVLANIQKYHKTFWTQPLFRRAISVML